MTELEWFNKPIKNSRDLILKEAFKLFLQKNVEKVTVLELERVTKLQRGAIFYHFKSKEEIFREVIEKYFFSPLNIFSPIEPNGTLSLEEYWNKKNDHLIKIQYWFKQEGVLISPFAAFFHLADQANLYVSDFNEKMLNLHDANKTYWAQILPLKSKSTKDNIDAQCIGHLADSLYLAKCYTASYHEDPPFCKLDNTFKLLIKQLDALYACI